MYQTKLSSQSNTEYFLFCFINLNFFPTWTTDTNIEFCLLI